MLAIPASSFESSTRDPMISVLGEKSRQTAKEPCGLPSSKWSQELPERFDG